MQLAQPRTFDGLAVGSGHPVRRRGGSLPGAVQLADLVSFPGGVRRRRLPLRKESAVGRNFGRTGHSYPHRPVEVTEERLDANGRQDFSPIFDIFKLDISL